MTPPLVRGWCPSLYEPMAAADGLIARVKPFVYGLCAADFWLIADLAQRHGSGMIELTSRANLQIRGLTQISAPLFAQVVARAGLASADPQVERRRNIQLGHDCGPRLIALAGALEAWIAQADALGALPSKFGFAFTGGQPIDADIVVIGEDRPLIRLGGSDICAVTADPLAAMQILALQFVAQAEGVSPPPRRMKALVARLGAADLLAQAGLVEVAAPLQVPSIRTDGGFDLGVTFGAMTSVDLRTVADLAERFGDGRVRLAPDRRLTLCRVGEGVRPALAIAATEAGFIVDPGDRRLQVRACVGRQGCARTQADVRADALALTSLHVERMASPRAILHVSGCEKGCAHPHAAEVTLAATGAGRYDLILNGAPGDPPTFRDLALDQIAHHLQATPS